MNEMVKTSKLKKAVQGTNIKLRNIQKQNTKSLSNTEKISTKLEKVVRFVDDKNGNNKENNKTYKTNVETSNNKRNMTVKNYSVTEIQISDLDTNNEVEDNGPLGWRSLPEIPSTS